ncbi:hypothetical protein GOV03_00445, partial [Candidatus Woesearchaeota archaeon]|nr:hypothetical protein [Candidatus Woesearchaeota archaeon]
MVTKRGQAAGAAVLLAIIVGVIIAFIILIPPSERAELLGEDSSDTTDDDTLTRKILLQENPGRLSYVAEKNIEKVIPSVHVFTKTGPSILIERGYLTVKNSLFSSQEQEVYFGIEDMDRTDNVLLDFMIEDYQGRLIVLLNGNEIFNRVT